MWDINRDFVKLGNLDVQTGSFVYNFGNGNTSKCITDTATENIIHRHYYWGIFLKNHISSKHLICCSASSCPNSLPIAFAI